MDKIMDINKKRTDITIGDYVLLSKFRDIDPYDPFYIGTVDEIGIDAVGGFIRCYACGQRCWRYVIKIKKETGDKILIENQLDLLKSFSGKPILVTDITTKLPGLVFE